ncbi:MAG: DUF1343 domain-containing protein [Flavobacteriales bacterium]|nr:DUF1343 domain-containing protein [Flavobacteriales bacterium]
MKRCITFMVLLLAMSGLGQQVSFRPIDKTRGKSVVTGSARFDQYLPFIKGRKVAVVANQTSLVDGVHLVDTLLASGVQVTAIFSPEHGFRGNAGAGETVSNSHDTKTGLPIYSIYGKSKKPTPIMLQGSDVVLFDIQDVGARFYTYLSSLHYVMEACAENQKQLIVLDRPNPNGFYTDGPVLEPGFESFVGMHPIPVVHGCTLGEMAKMINGEHWLKNGVSCSLIVVPCLNYDHGVNYELPVAPSPNLQTMSAVYLYPSLCFFEGTIVSVGRGTDKPFMCIGYPGNTTGTYTFQPKDITGVAMDPPHEGEVCQGHNLEAFGEFYFLNSKALNLEWLLGLYASCSDKAAFFRSGPNASTDFFDKLAGSGTLRTQIEAGKTADEIKASWEPGLAKYREMRKKYLIYPDATP